MSVMSRDEVRRCDVVAVEQFFVPSIVLMENAGLRAAERILGMVGEKAGPVAILAGTGNNGGDGYVVARQLANEGVAVKVLVCGVREKIGGDALVNLRIIEAMGIAVEWLNEAGAADQVKAFVDEAEIVVDALLGTGLTGAAREPMATVIAVVNEYAGHVVALDIPSGLNCDTGEAMGETVRAMCTITFAAMKKGFLQPGSHDYTGDVILAGIGIGTAYLETYL